MDASKEYTPVAPTGVRIVSVAFLQETRILSATDGEDFYEKHSFQPVVGVDNPFRKL